MICSKCQFDYDNSINPQCPNCMATNHSVSLVDTIKVDASISYKGRSNEKVNKKPLFEFKGGNEINRKLNLKVDRSYQIDRVRNRYTEIVKDSITGEVIHFVDEPLSEHKNHGDAKKEK